MVTAAGATSGSSNKVAIVPDAVRSWLPVPITVLWPRTPPSGRPGSGGLTIGSIHQYGSCGGARSSPLSSGGEPSTRTATGTITSAGLAPP